MTYDNMRKSCEIFCRYENKYNYFESDHDIIFGPNLDVEFTDEDKKKLIEFGWYKADEWDCWCC